MEKKYFDVSPMEKKLVYHLYIKNCPWNKYKDEGYNIMSCIDMIETNNYAKASEVDEFYKEESIECENYWKIIDKLPNFIGKTFTVLDLKPIYIDETYSDSEFTGDKLIEFFLFRLWKDDGIIERTTIKVPNYCCYTLSEKCLKDFNSKIAIVKKYWTQFKKLPKMDEDIDNNIEKWKTDFEFEDISYDASKVTDNKEFLLEYLKKIVNLDSDIFSLKKRYQALANEYKNVVRNNYFLELVKVNDSLNEQIIKIDEEINKLNDSIAKKPIFNKEIKIDLPKKPNFNISKPEQPILKKANIFNRKKVEIENEQLLQAFNDDMKKYNEKHEIYTKALKDYEDKVKELTEQANKKNEESYQKKLAEYNSKVIEYKEIIAQKKEEKEKVQQKLRIGIEKELEKNCSYTKMKSIEYEVEFIKEEIKKDIQLQNKLYSYNIIYGKYRNFIAMSSFIDYLLSGRCDSLDKSTGAYNLYEQESRTDIIINKMDVIIDSLEKIKENQYYIYSQLKDINSSLDKINGQLLVNNMLQTVQVSQLEKMIEKADKIAYNTEVTSYYAKKTAHYTEALTFINLINRL